MKTIFIFPVIAMFLLMSGVPLLFAQSPSIPIDYTVYYHASEPHNTFYGNGAGNTNGYSVNEIPFEYKSRLIVLKASFNNHHDIFDFILDSGAPTIVTSDVLSTCAPVMISSEELFDFNFNTKSINRYSTNNLSIGNKDFNRINVLSNEEVKEIPVLKNRADGGLIGADVMKHSIWMIDYQHKKIVITDNIDNLHLPELIYHTHMSATLLGSPIIQVILPGNKKVNALIDLGYNKSVILPYRFLNDSRITDSDPQSEQARLTTGYQSKDTKLNSASISFLQIGDLSAQNIKALFMEGNQTMVIGNEFLENYTVVFDFIDHQLILIPLENTIPSQLIMQAVK